MRQVEGINKDTMVGMLLILSQPTCILFDTDATISYMFRCFANKCGVAMVFVDAFRMITLPLGACKKMNKMYRDIDIEVAERHLPIYMLV